MDYSGPAGIAEIEDDLHLTDNEEQAMEHWLPLKPPARHEFQSIVASTSTKRPMDYGSDTISEPQSPAAKSTKLDNLRNLCAMFVPPPLVQECRFERDVGPLSHGFVDSLRHPSLREGWQGCPSRSNLRSTALLRLWSVLSVS
ncbi:hypothetical protein Pcinc_005875 [Petrolisthes cinctipes]|uniref:Uncharacterized protein n=1 Tax=Petrolisthes cinctipes TaxID=88211 RepID=A0AAE1GCK9_PETCI|nr:hypothetical protein Pcinc_005875 [Petrolisthes cinctipes]